MVKLIKIYSFHCERSELEQLLALELKSDIQNENVLDINFDDGIVITDKNTYKVGKYIFDCSGPAMVMANKLNLIKPFEKFADMKTQWGYWKIEKKDEALDTWADWTVLNRISEKSWMWQIPIYNGSILSMGVIQTDKLLEKEEFIQYVESYFAECYQLSSLYNKPQGAQINSPLLCSDKSPLRDS